MRPLWVSECYLDLPREACKGKGKGGTTEGRGRVEEFRGGSVDERACGDGADEIRRAGRGCFLRNINCSNWNWVSDNVLLVIGPGIPSRGGHAILVSGSGRRMGCRDRPSVGLIAGLPV